MSVLSLSYWESDVCWRQNSERFAELAPQNGGKQLTWRNYVTVTLSTGPSNSRLRYCRWCVALDSLIKSAMSRHPAQSSSSHRDRISEDRFVNSRKTKLNSSSPTRCNWLMRRTITCPSIWPRGSRLVEVLGANPQIFSRYCIVFYMYCILLLAAYQWPSDPLLLIWNEMKWNVCFYALANYLTVIGGHEMRSNRYLDFLYVLFKIGRMKIRVTYVISQGFVVQIFVVQIRRDKF